MRSTADGLLGMQAHPFFAGIAWDALAGVPAPYVPTVTHELDTQNFEEFEVKEPASESMSARRRLRADPNFIGYTYKNWEAVSPRDGEPGLSSLCSLTACFVSRCPFSQAQIVLLISDLQNGSLVQTRLMLTLDSFITH